MRKHFFLILSFKIGLCLFLATRLNAQVFNGTLTLTTQAQVDAFNYSEVTGIIFINSLGNSITNLDGLSELTTVGQSLFVGNNNHITNLNGLSNLTSVGSILSLSNLTNLTNLDGLSNLTHLGGLTIERNRLLTNINSLSNLTSISGTVDINNNDVLSDIGGLSNVVSISGSFTLKELPMLTNVDALTKLKFVIGRLSIWSCPITNIDGLSSLEGVGGLTLLSTAVTNVDGLSKLNDIDGLSLVQNFELTNIDGLSAITKISGLTIIEQNGLLTNLDGFSNITTIEGNLWIQKNSALTNLDGLSKLTTVGGDLAITENKPALIDFCGLTKLFHEGSVNGTIEIKNNGANTVALTTQPITVNADQGLCSATLSEATIGTATIVGCLEPFTSVTHTDFPEGFVFPVGITQITWTVTDGAGNTATTVQTITVKDNQVPVITCPGNMTVACASDVPAPNVNSVTATDNCSAIVTHIGDVITNQTCINRFTLTRTYKATDPSGNSATCSQVITVFDDVPPQINNLNVSQSVLWPPNHTMRDITLNYTVTDNCVSDPNATVTISSNEAVNGTADGDTDPDWEIVDNHHIRLRAERAANGTGRIYTITITVNDGCNGSVSAATQVMVVHNITTPHSGSSFKVGSTVPFDGEFWDKAGNSHFAKWTIDDNLSVKGIVTEPVGNKNGKITGSYKFNSPGVYKLQMNVTDQTGVMSYANTSGDLEAIVVIYDPNGGNTYGGGYFNSPAGALRTNPSATGKASYGFAMNYFKNSTNPKGETQFEFKVGSFEFNALNFEYLVINNAMAQFKGTGKIIGGQSGVGFTMTVVDGQLDGSGVDKIRMKIYNKNNGAVIYDNQPGASDAALPTQAVGANSLIVISGINSSITSANTNQKGQIEVNATEVSNNLNVITYPNPSTNNFSITVQADLNEKISMQVVDMYGRMIEQRNVNANSIVKFGDRYRAGTYFVRVFQGKQHKEIKLVKIN